MTIVSVLQLVLLLIHQKEVIFCFHRLQNGDYHAEILTEKGNSIVNLALNFLNQFQVRKETYY